MIVDAETHPLAMKQNGEVEDSCSQLLSYMDQNGIDASVIMPGAQAQNVSGEVLEKTAKKYSGKLIPFCRFYYHSPISPYNFPFPENGWITDVEGALSEFSQMMSSGVFKGVGELNIIEMGMKDPLESIKAYFPFMNIVAKSKVPVQFHTGIGLGKEWLGSSSPMRFFDPILIDELSSRYPEVPIIVDHCGGMLDPFGQGSLFIAAKNDNVFLNISNLILMDSAQGILTYKKFFERAMQSYRIGAERLIFGSDWYPEYDRRGLCRQTVSVLNQITMSENDRDLIMGGNMEKILS